MTVLRVLSTLGVAGVMEIVVPEFEKAHGISVDVEFQPTALLMQRIRAGERGDLTILTAEGIEELIASGVVAAGSRMDLARSYVGVAVAAGAAPPDIGTKDAFVATLLAAKSIAMSKAGASGIFMAGLLQRLGVADEVAAKATVIPNGFTGELVKRGEVELAIQQISELMVVPGIQIVGRLPTEIAGITDFTAGIFTGGCAAATAMVAMLSAPDAAELYRVKGLEPLAAG
jgi:molybdate transport system substrate-binding protein